MNATRIVIADRLSTIRHADRIYVLDHGRLTQAGAFDELMAVEGPFRRLAARQLL
jgi:ABC-type multidrug transport system fused ATPase/permease subunit